MCGRYAINQTGRHLAATYVVDWIVDPPPLPRFNIAPQTEAPVLRTRRDGSLALDVQRWGLIPYWAKDATISRRTINARCETAATTPAFRTALERRRCIVPASGFFEWKGMAGRKLPYWLHPADGAPMDMAGVWESWRPAPDAPPVRTFAILTTAANRDVATLHDRMPLLVRPGDRDAWLDPATPAAVYTALMQPPPEGTLAAHPVSLAVNRAGSEGPELIAPVPEEPPPLLLL